MSIRTTPATPQQNIKKTHFLTQEHKPPSFWKQIKSICNKILSHTLFAHKPKFKVYENPLYSRPKQVTKTVGNETTQHVNDISKLSSDMIYPPKTALELASERLNAFSNYKRTIRLIDGLNNISDDERKMYHQLNTLNKAILLHPDFASTEGIFRLSGKKADMDHIFECLNSGKKLTQEFIEQHNISLPTITLAYKELFGQIMDKQNYSTYFLKHSPDQALADAFQNQQDVIAFMRKNNITGEKERNILANTKNRNNQEIPTLPFNMLISLFADIAKNPTAKMNAKNLAICIAPRLLAEKFKIPSKENLQLNNRMITFIEALIHAKLHA